jgi:leucyl aminopeptidase
MITPSTRQGTLEGTKADLLAHFVFDDKKLVAAEKKRLRKVFGSLAALDHANFSGKELETLLLFPEGKGVRRLLLVGLGKPAALSQEKLRRAAARAAKTAQEINVPSLHILEPDPQIIEKSAINDGVEHWERVGTSLAEGAVLAMYKFRKYLTSDNEKPPTLKRMTIVSEHNDRRRKIRSGVRYAQLVCESVYLARDLENAPGNEIYPDSLARRAREAGNKARVKVRILDEKNIRKLGMGGLLGVSQGSDRPPRFIIMDYNAGARRKPAVVLIGKGVTFDSGGISIKPAASMAEMKMDMSGAAAVIGTMQTVARLRLPLRVVGLIPATENLLGGSALKPGDILRHLNGKTSEVDNTDAEGRLILADALAYATRYKPDLVIDLATLTGACVVALGHYATGMMGNDQPAMDRLKETGERTYERVWQLPMFDEYDKLIKSDVADVKNVGPRGAGAITAAMFLRRFIGDYKWIHLDIAGTAIMQESLDYIPKGGSGVGVRLLTEFLRTWSKS